MESGFEKLNQEPLGEVLHFEDFEELGKFLVELLRERLYLPLVESLHKNLIMHLSSRMS